MLYIKLLIGFSFRGAEQSDDSEHEGDADKDEAAAAEEEPSVPEPERDAALEEAYKLEKEDAGSDEEDSDDDDDEDEADVNGVAKEPLSKEQKREAEVCVERKKIILFILMNIFHRKRKWPSHRANCIVKIRMPAKRLTSRSIV